MVKSERRQDKERATDLWWEKRKKREGGMNGSMVKTRPGRAEQRERARYWQRPPPFPTPPPPPTTITTTTSNSTLDDARWREEELVRPAEACTFADSDNRGQTKEGFAPVPDRG